MVAKVPEFPDFAFLHLGKFDKNSAVDGFLGAGWSVAAQQQSEV